MNTIQNKVLFFLASIALLVLSCKKTEFNPDFELPRQFKPGDIEINAGQTDVMLRWNPSLFSSENEPSYTVQLAKDSLFTTPVLFEEIVDTAFITITDDDLEVMEYYFARVKANANGSTAESGWVYSNRFRITGEQIFLPIVEADLKDTSVILKWTHAENLTHILLKETNGATINIPLTPADVAADQKQINGLSPLTNYTAEIYRNAILKGTINFTTPEPNIYSVVLQPGDDLVEAVNNAADGDIIGLDPGTYNTFNSSMAFTNLVVTQKTIVIQSTSGDPSNTIVNFKQIDIKGTGAGLTVKGITWDGTAASADYFLNLVGFGSDSEASNFTNITVDNCIVTFTKNCFMRGNRGGNNAHKINTIKVNNTIASKNGTGSYHYFMIDKLEFQKLELTNNTFYDVARAMISWATNLTVPQVPQIIVANNTINSFGFGGRNNILLDANNNNINALFRDNIIANTPKPGESVGTSAMRANAASTIEFYHNNYFKFEGGTPLEPITFPAYVQLTNNTTIDLGWTASTTDFTLPAGSPLRTGSSTGGPVGDPRWAQ